MLPDRAARAPDRAAMVKALADLLVACGAELDAETRGTPERVAKAFAEDLLDGYLRDPVQTLRSSLGPAPRKAGRVVAAQIDFHAMSPPHPLPSKGLPAGGHRPNTPSLGFAH